MFEILVKHADGWMSLQIRSLSRLWSNLLFIHTVFPLDGCFPMCSKSSHILIIVLGPWDIQGPEPSCVNFPNGENCPDLYFEAKAVELCVGIRKLERSPLRLTLLLTEGEQLESQV